MSRARANASNCLFGHAMLFCFACLLGSVPETSVAQTVSFIARHDFAAGTYHSLSAVVGDFNGDGIQDLAVTNNGLNRISVLLGNGDGTFQPPTTRDFAATPMQSR